MMMDPAIMSPKLKSPWGKSWIIQGIDIAELTISGMQHTISVAGQL
jgi:hypothetical protein